MNNLNDERILIISPHPDDETFGCSGLILKAKSLGSIVSVVLVSVATVDQYVKDGKEKITYKKRVNEFESAMQYLEVDEFLILDHKDVHSKLDTIPRVDLINEFEAQIRAFKPSLVILPAISYHQDHEAVFNAGFTACRPCFDTIKSVWGYNSLGITWSLDRDKFHPNIYIDISDYIDKKLEAISLYKSQLRPAPHHCNAENFKVLAQTTGREVGVNYAESFVCYRSTL